MEKLYDCEGPRLGKCRDKNCSHRGPHEGPCPEICKYDSPYFKIKCVLVSKPKPRLSSRQAAKAFISKKYEKNSCANMCGIAMELFQAGVRWSRNNRA